jgi:hypothetical protein
MVPSFLLCTNCALDTVKHGTLQYKALSHTFKVFKQYQTFSDMRENGGGPREYLLISGSGVRSPDGPPFKIKGLRRFSRNPIFLVDRLIDCFFRLVYGGALLIKKQCQHQNYRITVIRLELQGMRLPSFTAI